MTGNTHCSYPRHDYMSYQAFSPQHVEYLCATASIPTTYTYKQASNDPK